MAKDNNFTVMVSVLEGRYFPKQPSHRVSIQGTFNGVVLTADPVPQVASPIWDTELAWDLEARALHFLRSQRATIKLLCHTVSPAGNRERLGYIVLDLRATDSFPAREVWRPLINNKLSAKARPELKIAFGAGPQLLLETETRPPSRTLTASHGGPSPAKSSVSSPSAATASPHQHPPPQRTPCTPTTHPIPAASSPPRAMSPLKITHHASPPVHCTKPRLRGDGAYVLGTDPTEVYQLAITLVGLKDLRLLSVIPSPKHPSSGFYLFLQLFQHQLKTQPFPNYKSPSFPEERLALKILVNRNDLAFLFHSANSLKIYLAFDEQWVAEATLHWAPLLENIGEEQTYHLPLLEPGVHVHSHPQLDLRASLILVPTSKPPSPTAGMSLTNPPSIIETENCDLKHEPEAQPTMVWHQYRFGIDIKGIRDLVLPSANVFVKYSFPAFGTFSPFISHPPVQVFKGIETPFHQAFSAYEFVMSPVRLHHCLDSTPLELYLYHKDNFTKDQCLGLARIPLSPILHQPKRPVQDAVQKIQLLDQWVHVFTQESSLQTRTATLRLAFSLEDFGVIEEQVGFEPDDTEASRAADAVSQVPPPPFELSAQDAGNTSLPSLSQTKLAPQPDPPQASPRTGGTLPASPPASTPPMAPVPSELPSNPSHHASLEALWQQAQAQVESWKQKQEAVFLRSLQKRDQTAMEELEQKMLQKEAALETKVQEFRVLEQQLEKLLAELEGREAKLAEAEQAMEDRHVDMERAFEKKCMQVEGLASTLANEYQQKHHLESQLTQELQRQKADLIQERNEWEAKYRQLDAQYFEFRNKHTVPETEYNKKIVELTEKLAGAEKKMSAYKTQKGHFKAQWLKTLAEYAQFKKSAELSSQQSLQQKQQEIEAQQETLKQIQQELQEIKSTQDKFKSSVLELKVNAPIKSPEKTSGPPPSSQPQLLPPPIANSMPPVFDYQSQIQRLSEERELLLKSGVYRSSDPLIRDITLKIEEFSRKSSC